MAYSPSTLRLALLGGLLGLTACSPLDAVLEAAGPEFTLSVDEPIAEFDVVWCLDRPGNIRWSSTGANVEFELEIAGAATGSLVATLDAVGDAEGDRAERDLAVAEERSPGLYSELEQLDGSGRACTAPQRVQFEFLGEDDTTQIQVAWTAELFVSYEPGLRGDSIDEGDLEIEITPVTQ